MRRARYLPSFLLCMAAVAPFAIGCDLLKQQKPDGADASVVVPPAVTDTAATAANTAAVTTVTPTAPPLNPATPVAPNGQPVARVDGGGGGSTIADSGVKSDAAAPAPTPQFPGFDASAIQGFDAGNLFKVPDGGFKPPWVK